jgi:hypothetical protein
MKTQIWGSIFEERKQELLGRTVKTLVSKEKSEDM